MTSEHDEEECPRVLMRMECEACGYPYTEARYPTDPKVPCIKDIIKEEKQVKLDLTKPVKTRGGREARIYSTDGGGGYPVHGAIYIEEKKQWVQATWTLDGYYTVNNRVGSCDLVNVSKKITRWINFYRHSYVTHSSREAADSVADTSRRIACVKVEFEEGDGI